jgi:polar amino acid transport system substrate-binding protein
VRAAHRAAALVVAATISAGARAAGQESVVRIVSERFPPFSYEEAGVVKGASTDVVRAVMEKAGLRHSIEILPWTRAFDAARHERNTFIYSVARTKEREGQLIWVGKICERRLALYCLKERTDLLGHPLAELKASTFAVIQGDASAALILKLGVSERNLHLLRDAEADLAANHVLEGRSDFFVSNPERLQYATKGTPLEGRFRQHSVLWEGDGYYLAANPASDPALVGRVREAFGSLAAQGALKGIFARAMAKPAE